ncbi:cellular tumor antigen p53-like isoform X2 [Bradysia coprophila]|uniref:cellular tumor antigen p53-like isoform X2 n=1 Tax=Bradysia coprophila TaxID=38358 RepID=UPI00187D9A8D|nr:cellular tumor antigen p53-like isoform X2 [Bradysia coprophila]
MNAHILDNIYDADHGLGELCAMNLETFVDFTVNIPQRTTDPIPEHWNKFPNMENVDTNHSFDMHIDPGENQNWLFNPKIGKVYIKLNSVMKVTLSYKPYSATNLFLRAMILYSSPDDMHLPVKRCANHRVSIGNNQGVPQAHILKCCHPKTQYVGGENGHLFGERLSVVVPLDRPVVNEDGYASESLMLEFMCQNSCTTGINRKSTAVVFTLENSRNEILGKRVMLFKVCSCPKRDMQREDTTYMPRKREAGSSAIPYGKRPTKMACLTEIKTEPPATPCPSNSFDEASRETPVTVTLTMPSKDSMQHVLRCAYNEVTGLMASKEDHSQLLLFAQKIEGLLVAHS